MPKSAPGLAACFLALAAAASVTASVHAQNPNPISGGIPDSPETIQRSKEAFVFVRKGDALLEKGKAAEALQMYEKARSINPRSGYYYYSARAYTLLGKNEAARQMYEKFITFKAFVYDFDTKTKGDLWTKEGPVAEEVAMHYAILLSRMGRQEEAIEMYHFGLRYLNRQNNQSYEPVPLTLVFGTRAGETPYSAEALQAAAHLALAITKLYTSHEEALRQAGHAVALQPEWALARFYHGFILEKADSRNKAAAVAEYQQVLKLATDKTDKTLLAVTGELLKENKITTKVSPRPVRMAIPTLEEARLQIVRKNSALKQ